MSQSEVDRALQSGPPLACLRGGPLDGLKFPLEPKLVVLVIRVGWRQGAAFPAVECGMPTCHVCPEHPAVAVYRRAAPESPIMLHEATIRDRSPGAILAAAAR